MPTMILDPELAKKIRAQRAACGGDRYDEVWEGIYMMQALPNNEHQKFVARSTHALEEVIGMAGLGDVFPGVNVSDCADNWTHNYRCPDVAVFLNGTSAVDRGTFWQGGPDLAIEIISPDDQSREKLDFYAQVNTQELLIIDRNPWQIELYQLNDRKFVSSGPQGVDATSPLASRSTGVTFQFVANPKKDRPTLVLTDLAANRRWTI